MGVVRMCAEDLIDPDTEAQYVFIHSVRSSATIHRHDYYEIFLVVRGAMDHVVNYRKQRVGEGCLVFVRPDDAHYYTRELDKDCQFINLAFPQHTAEELFDYLGAGLHKDRLLSGDMPPLVQLTKCECNALMTKLEEFDAIQRAQSPEIARMKLRALLIDVISTYFSPVSHERKNTKPDWLVSLCREMQIKENTVEGIPAMRRLTGMTHEYLCRQFKAHMKVTPVEYVNGLRLHYAHNLLTQTDDKILNIAMEVGFESLSHFYHVFKKQYGVSPAVYRKHQNKT